MTDEEDLSFCGVGSVEKHLTLRPATIQYDLECNICPDNGDCVTAKYITPGTDLTFTCWTEFGSAVLGNAYVHLKRNYLPISGVSPNSGYLIILRTREKVFNKSEIQTDDKLFTVCD
jgi:hypothetical protein